MGREPSVLGAVFGCLFALAGCAAVLAIKVWLIVWVLRAMGVVQ